VVAVQDDPEEADERQEKLQEEEPIHVHGVATVVH
jgi:hypothetical protein